jgi:hypothetical protein
MSRPVVPRVLVARGVDGLLVGWLAVIVWVAVFVGQHVGLFGDVGYLSAIYWIGAVVTAAHFGLSYHLAYSGGLPSVRTRPLALCWGPLALVAVLGGLVAVSLQAGPDTARDATSALITSVYVMTTWHYVKQVYGVGRVGAAYAGVSLGTWDVRLLRFGLYPLWFFGAAQVLVRGASYNLAGYQVGFSVLPGWLYSLLRVLAIASALPVAAAFVAIARRTGRMPPSLLLAPYVAAFVWLALPTDPVLTLLLLAPFHALQYLAVGHRAELAVAEGRPGRHGLVWWLNIFAGAACGGLLLSRWAPHLLDAQVRNGQGPLLFTAAFFVFLNMHHYLIDASIWRSSGDLVRAMVRKPVAVSAPAPQPAPQLIA